MNNNNKINYLIMKNKKFRKKIKIKIINNKKINKRQLLKNKSFKRNYYNKK